MDYEKMGLKVGLEIHQQLDTSSKLFCNCKPDLFREEPEITFLRRLRPTQSELGQIDPAAHFEFQRGMQIRYEASFATSCLVEMDEEPPHLLNKEAVDAVLTMALMMNATLVDEIHVMRKAVIDGSNTTGFQRTCIVAQNGRVNVSGKEISIQHLSLEEDAARKTGDEGINIVRYRIDRLGIPLVEIATAPVIVSPREAGDVALAIGSIIRVTGKVRRGLGTIRQDLNISVRKGALVEVKGVQELELIPLSVEYEAQRQSNLIRITEELRRTGAKEEQLEARIYDTTAVFKQTESKVIRRALDNEQRVLSVKLPHFKGFLKQELSPNFRLGTEMADRARYWGRVGGIFHTDEMPAYGITIEEIENLRNQIKAEEDSAIVFVADSSRNAEDALKAVVERAKEALRGVPEETRAANPDGTTRYMRPRPGAARMYPETDVPPFQVTKEYADQIRLHLPELPEQKMEKLIKEYKLNVKLAKQILDSEYNKLFLKIAGEGKVSPTTVAAFLTETLKSLKRDGVLLENVSESQLIEVFRAIGSGRVAKEAAADLVVWLSKNTNRNVEDAVASLGLKMFSEEDLENLIDETIKKNESAVRERGKGAFGMLMGLIMREVRGRTNAKLVGEILKKRLEERF